MNARVLFSLCAALAVTGCDKKGGPPPSPQAPDAKAITTTRAPDAGALAGKPIAGPFQMTVTSDGPLAPGAAAALTLELRDAAGTRVTALDVVHEKHVHLIVVSADLSSFDHIHPEPRPDGLLGVSLTLPVAGSYVAFADFKPTGAAQSVARSTLDVPGEAPPPTPLQATALPARGTFDGFEVGMRSKAPLVQGTDAILEFEIFDKGAPVADLRNYLGARGHCVAISEDSTQYLHSHPLGGTGSKVQFHTTLPAAGKYKVWAEFRPAGKPVRASFVVEVLAEAPHAHDDGDKGHDHGDKGHDHGDKGHSH